MAITKYSCLQDLVAAAGKDLDNIDVFTFDVFDTLFVRRVHDPDIVKKATARFIQQRAAAIGIDVNLKQVEERRDQIENQHRQRNGQSHPDFEANYDQFMPEALESLFADQATPELFTDVAGYEIKMENAMLVARAELVAFIQQLRDAGKRLFLLSDIYLPAKYIKQMLLDKGLLDLFEDVISSADSFKAKASGHAFPLIEERFSLDRQRWRHIGDNPHSDALKPDEFGLDCYLIEDSRERHRKGLAFRYHHYARQNQYWKGRYVQQLMLPLEAENAACPALYQDGHNTFAYMIGYALLKLKERIVEMNISTVYFCSREGWMMKRCWELMAPILWPDLARQIRIEYLHVSRLAQASASRANQGLPMYDVNIAFAPVQNKDFNDIARVFALNKTHLQPYLDEHELAWDETISPLGRSAESYGKLYNLVNDAAFIQQIKDDAQQAQQGLERYLEDKGFFDQAHVALVDIGWLGTIQYYLDRAVSHRADRPRISGFMLAADRQFEYPTTDVCSYEGLLYDRMRQQHATSVVTFCKDVIEEVTREDHPTLLGYQPEGDNDVTLVFRENEDAVAKAEHQQFDYYEPVHQGIFDGIERFAAAVAVTDYDTEELREWMNQLAVAKLAFPRTEEVMRLKNISHQDDFAGGGRVMPKKLARKVTALWDQSRTALRFSPLLRLRTFISHMRKFRGL